MKSFFISRLLQTIPTLLIIATLTFFMTRFAPGGPFDSEKAIPEEIKVNLESHFGLNLPLFDQYLLYMKNLLAGDLGPSFKYVGWDVSELIGVAFPVSLGLGVSALLIALFVGLPAGMVAALRKNTLWDYLPMGLAMVGICLPTFVLGPILIMIFSTKLNLLPALGWYSWSDLILPSLTLGLFYAAYIARLTRAGMLETLKQDYVRTARAKGASPSRVVIKHALRGGLLPVVTFLGPAFAGLVSGSFIIESIFFIPGLGKFFVTAAFNRDYTMVLGTVLFYATLIIALNLLVDFLQAWLDPKAREQR
ncbi:MAG TPA: ABC transporter [Opitutae bacterium]|nr:ABC transporter [Puniceicoccaceae bacterium]HCY58861.1 ABC transporter [Opitutae bacterium]|tara:strand:- start:4184 stop:5104 length:921 start_codon:yes stop_codon:yes gene_type:complete